MSLQTVSQKRKRIYQRKFDHDEARRVRVEEGLSWEALGRRFGVSSAAVRRVCDLEFREEFDRRTRDFGMSGTCRKCGSRRVRYSKKNDTGLCMKCQRESTRTRFRYDESGELSACWCATCKSWKSPDDFQKSRNELHGLHPTCRACGTILRRDYRNRHKVPCERCGNPCLPPNEKGYRRAERAVCVNCYRLEMKTPEWRAANQERIQEYFRAHPQASRGGRRKAGSAEPNLCPKGHVRAQGRKTCDECMAGAA